MDIAELERLIDDDKARLSRFPVRFIFVKNIQGWDTILSILKERAKYIFRLSEYCADDDSIPDVMHLMRDIRSIDRGDALVIPLGEYLRLFGDRYFILKQLAEYYKSDGISGGTRDRIYVPLYDVEDIFYTQMSGLSRFSVPDESAKCYELVSNPSECCISLKIVSENLYSVLSASEEAKGLKQFMQYWEKGGVRDICLVTRFAYYIHESMGIYDIRTYTTNFKLFKDEFDDSNILCEKWGTSDQWGWLYSLIKASDIHDIDTLFTKEFNMLKLDVYDILSDWKSYDENHKWLAWLACKVKNPSGYLAYVMHRNIDYYRFEEDLIFTILDVVKSMYGDNEQIRDIIMQRKQLLIRMGINSIANEFWEKLNDLPDDICRLMCLTNITNEEKYRIIELVNKLINLETDENRWKNILSAIYPELHYYLDNIDYGNELATTYFYKYRIAKLCDEVPDDMRNMTCEIKNKGLLWQYTPRYEFLKRYNEPAIIYWGDGIGAEWIGLMTGLLRDELGNLGYDYEYKIVRANLPTTTEFNNDWQNMNNYDYREYKDYDILVHSYNCRYPKYIIDEFDRIKDIVRNAVSDLKNGKNIIITADHGTSRLAALNREASVDAGNCLVKKHGRYCESDGYISLEKYPDCIEDNNKIIFASYKRFKSSGNVPGEIHGGATLEEALVPVIIIRERGLNKDVKFILLTSNVGLNVKNEATLAISVDGNLTQLSMIVGNKRFVFENKGNDRWETTIKGLNAHVYRGTLFGNGKNLGDIEFTVTKGLKENDLGL